MPATHTYTNTAQDLAEELTGLGLYREYTMVKDRNGEFTHVELTTRAEDSVIVYTHKDGKKEFMVFTVYLSDEKSAHRLGGCRAEHAAHLLTGLSKQYSP